MMRVPVKPELLRWARERASLSREDIIARFPKFGDWETGEIQPTLKQLEAFAKRTHAPIGYFFQESPPKESVPLPDFRTVGSGGLERISPDLLDTIHLCLERQDWYRDFARGDLAPLIFINWKDTKAARMFTLAHELARLWLGESGVSDIRADSFPSDDIERWCQRVARAVLASLAPRAGVLAQGRGGMRNWPSNRFAAALVPSALAGKTMFREAFRLLGVKNLQGMYALGRRLGIPVACPL